MTRRGIIAHLAVVGARLRLRRDPKFRRYGTAIGLALDGEEGDPVELAWVLRAYAPPEATQEQLAHLLLPSCILPGEGVQECLARLGELCA